MSSATVRKAIEFDYGASRERIRRKDIPSVTVGVTPNLVTHFVGNAEIVRYATGKVEVRRYVAGTIRVQTRESPTYTSTREDYLLTDAQGSTYAIVKDTGSVLGIMGFDPWGLRRTATNWTPLANPLTFDASGVTRHGYTGHEQVDEAGLIHMNGRIYDPKLMRFVQADPIIQSPFDSQSYNRYTYVFNNPLAHTDPTGYWGKEEQGYLRAAVAIVITIYTGGTAAGASWGAFSGASLTTGQAFAVTVIGGAAAGAVQTGTLKGAATGAISGAMFFGVGQYFDAAGWAHLGKDTANALSGTGHAAKTLAHGVAGGITAELGGGNFGNGFITAGVTQAFAPGIDRVDGGKIGFSVPRTLAAAALGGTASALSGGKFANGAVTAAFGRAFNDEAAAISIRRQARHINARVSEELAQDPSAVPIISIRELGTLALADMLRIENGPNLQSMSTYEFFAYAMGPTGDSMYVSGWAGPDGRQIRIGATGVHNAQDLNYYYQGQLWATRGATVESLNWAVRSFNGAQFIGGHGARNLAQIPAATRWANFGYGFSKYMRSEK